MEEEVHGVAEEDEEEEEGYEIRRADAAPLWDDTRRAACTS